jgi:hypothetical protein
MPLVPVVLTPALVNLGAGTNSLRWANSRADWGVGRNVHSDGASDIVGGNFESGFAPAELLCMGHMFVYFGCVICMCCIRSKHCGRRLADGECIQGLVGTPVPRGSGGQYATVLLERKGGDVGGLWFGGGCHNVGCGQEG